MKRQLVGEFECSVHFSQLAFRQVSQSVEDTIHMRGHADWRHHSEVPWPARFAVRLPNLKRHPELRIEDLHASARQRGHDARVQSRATGTQKRDVAQHLAVEVNKMQAEVHRAIHVRLAFLWIEAHVAASFRQSVRHRVFATLGHAPVHAVDAWPLAPAH